MVTYGRAELSPMRYSVLSPVPAAMPLHQYPPVPLASSCKQVTASWCPRSVRSGVSRLMRWLVKS